MDTRKMRRPRLRAFAIATIAAATCAGAIGSTAGPASASSHRDAPLIAEDPSADNTDLYAFRSKDAPNALTVIANWNPG